MSPKSYLFLSLSEPQAAAPSASHEGADAPVRCLNVSGRWALRGTADVPLLVWRTGEATEAQAAAERAAKARDQAVAVASRGNAHWEEGREIQVFSPALAPVLLAPMAQSAAKARRLRTEADKLEAFCRVVLAASAASNQEAFAEVSRAASTALRAKFGGGTITSVFAWLAGPAGQAALESVLTGEVELTGSLSSQQVIGAAALAQEAELLRERADSSLH